MGVPLVTMRITIRLYTFDEMVVDPFSSGEAGTTYDTEVISFCSLGLLWRFAGSWHNLSAVHGCPSLSYSRGLGRVIGAVIRHLHSKSVMSDRIM